MSAVLPPKDDSSRSGAGGLAAARRKLSEMVGRPFDVDALLAQERAREERSRSAKKAAQDALEQTLEKARVRRLEIQAQAATSRNETLSEKEALLEKQNRRFAKELRDKRQTEYKKDAPQNQSEKNE